MSNNIYNILGKLKGITDTAALTPEAPVETVYESVEPRGSITEAVKGLESKYATFKEAKAKPDFLDVDKDGDKAEPFKKAVKDKNAVEEGTIAKPKKDLKKHSATAKRMAMQKKADKGHEEWLDHLEKTDPDHPSLKYRKQATNEGQGPYELYNPKHPKFKANYDKYKAKHPDCTLAEFVAAMKKREAKMNEAAYDEPAAPDADAIAKRKRLQAIKDRQEDEGDIYSKKTNTPIRKIPGKAYGGAAQKDAPEDDLDEEYQSPYAPDPQVRALKDVIRTAQGASGGSLTPDQIAQIGQMSTAWNKKDANTNYRTQPGQVRLTGKNTQPAAAPVNDEVDEVAPPGAKAERMVKHIKKGYSKDGNLTKKEKGIAYATAWKAKKAGVVEATQFSDKIANSKAELKKAKPAMVKESRMLQEGDYFYETVGKALAEKNPHLDTAGSDFYAAVRQEMVAQGIPPNKARNILTMDEDFLSDVATSYGHYCQELAETGAPVNSFLGDAEELDEIARLAGLPVRENEKSDEAKLDHYHELVKRGVDPDEAEMIAFNDEGDEELDEREQFQSMPQGFASGTPKAPAAPTAKPTYDKSKLNPNPPVREEEMEEGNEFSGALAAAKASGAKEFEVDGKKYTVKEDINVNITANGQEDALNLFRKLAGMEVKDEPMVQNTNGTEVPLHNIPTLDVETAIAQGIVEPVEVDEERDIEYANTPNEKIGPVGSAIPSGDDLHRSKKQFRKEYPGDNPMAVAETKEDSLWKKYSTMLKGLIG